MLLAPRRGQSGLHRADSPAPWPEGPELGLDEGGRLSPPLTSGHTPPGHCPRSRATVPAPEPLGAGLRLTFRGKGRNSLMSSNCLRKRLLPLGTGAARLPLPPPATEAAGTSAPLRAAGPGSSHVGARHQKGSVPGGPAAVAGPAKCVQVCCPGNPGPGSRWAVWAGHPDTCPRPPPPLPRWFLPGGAHGEMELITQAVPGLGSWQVADAPPPRHLSLDGAGLQRPAALPASRGPTCRHGEHPREGGVARQPLDPQAAVSR